MEINNKSKVPSLKFAGLRPSLQGCSGLGAPPPEEPIYLSLSLYPSIHPSIHPSIPLSLYPSIYLSLYLSIYLSAEEPMPPGGFPGMELPVAPPLVHEPVPMPKPLVPAIGARPVPKLKFGGLRPSLQGSGDREHVMTTRQEEDNNFLRAYQLA